MNDKIVAWWFIHFLSGFIFHKLSRPLAYSLFVGAETVENLFLLPQPEEPISIGFGLMFDVIGYETGRKYGEVKI